MPVPETLCVYQFKVVLRGISPMIWRRLLLRSDHSIADLHYTIQIAIGWSDSHVHRLIHPLGQQPRSGGLPATFTGHVNVSARRRETLSVTSGAGRLPLT